MVTLNVNVNVNLNLNALDSLERRRVRVARAALDTAPDTPQDGAPRGRSISERSTAGAAAVAPSLSSRRSRFRSAPATTPRRGDKNTSWATSSGLRESRVGRVRVRSAEDVRAAAGEDTREAQILDQLETLAHSLQVLFLTAHSIYSTRFPVSSNVFSSLPRVECAQGIGGHGAGGPDRAPL